MGITAPTKTQRVSPPGSRVVSQLTRPTHVPKAGAAAKQPTMSAQPGPNPPARSRRKRA